MFEDFMKDEPRHKNRNENPSSKKTIIPELKQLENEIYLNRPNNIIKFIRNWANQRCKEPLNAEDEQSEGSDLEDVEAKFNSRRYKRRNAVILWSEDQRDKEVRGKCQPSEKLEQVKSRMMINLANMRILHKLTPEEIWDLVEKSQVKEFQEKETIIQKDEPLRIMFIILSGSVIRTQGERKPIFYQQGEYFGEEAIIFQRPSEDLYSAYQKTKVALIWGIEISVKVQEANKRRYNMILKGLSSTEYLVGLFNDELEKVATMLLYQKQIKMPEKDNSLNGAQYKKSFFMVTEGVVEEFNSRLNSQIIGEPLREFQSGQTFGTQVLLKREKQLLYISKSEVRVIEVKISEVEKIIGPINKIVRRKNQGK